MNKKNYIYFLAPIAGVLIFAAIYWNFLSQYDKEQDRRAAKAKAEKDVKTKLENDQKKEAYDLALKASERRAQEREAKAKKDDADREARQAAIENRAKASREEFKLADKVKALAKEIEVTKKEVAEAEENKKKAQAEEAFLRTYVKQAEANRQSLTAVLENIQKADQAAIDAAKAAEAAAKSKK